MSWQWSKRQLFITWQLHVFINIQQCLWFLLAVPLEIWWWITYWNGEVHDALKRPRANSTLQVRILETHILVRISYKSSRQRGKAVVKMCVHKATISFLPFLSRTRRILLSFAKKQVDNRFERDSCKSSKAPKHLPVASSSRTNRT